MRLDESEVYVDERGYAHDDEGNTWKVRMKPGLYKASEVLGPAKAGTRKGSRSHGRRSSFSPNYSDRQEMQIAAIDTALRKMPKNDFLQSVRKQIHFGRFMSEKQIKVIKGILKKLRLENELKVFESKDSVMIMGDLINRIEEGSREDRIQKERNKVQQEKKIKEIVKKYAKRINEVTDKLIFYSQFLEAIQEELDEAGIPFRHPVWRATSDIKAKMGDVVEVVTNARKFGF